MVSAFAATLILASLLAPYPVRSTASVDLVLVLAIDVSGSVDPGEFVLQRQGIASAFLDPSVVEAIQSGRHRRIAVAAVQWAGLGEQSIAVPWTVIDGHSSAQQFAGRLSSMKRRYNQGFTHIAGVIQFSRALVERAPFAAGRHVVDISGDGINTVGNSPHGTRDAAVRAGLTINGLAITNENAGLAEYYRLSVIGGPDAFVIPARNYADYPPAILRKLLREIRVRRLM